MDRDGRWNRRDFLRRALQVSAIAASSAAIADCGGTSIVAPVTTSTTTSTLGPPATKDWSQLDAALTGRLVQPMSSTYDRDRLLYNSRFSDLHPEAIAYCASEDDVARCVMFAREHGVDIAARSGGHSYGGYSSSTGLVLDVSPMAGIAVDTRANRATVGAGARLIDVYNVVGQSERLLPGGTCPTVGIAGLALGGGVGVFGRNYGLTSDNIQSVRMVTADGRRVAASAQENVDLWWAAKGGGGGNFGVVTSFTFGVHPMPVVTLFTLDFPWGSAGELLNGWQQWMVDAPDELWSTCEFLSEGTAGLVAQVSGAFCGSPSDAAVHLRALNRLVGTAPISQFVGGRDYLAAMKNEAGCADLTIASCHLTSAAGKGQLSREAYAAKSTYVRSPMSATSVASFVHAIERFAAQAPYLGGALAFDAYGGAINRVPAHETAFVHRDALACVQATCSWTAASSVHELHAGHQWLQWLASDVFDASTGAYQNYIDPTLEDWANAYYGTNLPRLQRIKSAHDPDNVFHFAQSIARA